MNSIVLTLHENEWQNILLGKKKLMIKKNKPKFVEYPFKVFCYVVERKSVCGEYNCSKIEFGNFYEDYIIDSMLSLSDIRKFGRGSNLYIWYITNTSEYEEAVELKEYGIEKSPQNWCYNI